MPAIHTHFRFHPQITQIGCYWGEVGHTELYLLEGEQLAIIDTGCSDTPEGYILPALQDMGYSPRDLSVIINTHGHFDHAGGDARLVAATGAQVWMPEKDVEVAENLDRQFELYFAQNDTLVNRQDRLAASLANLEQQGDPIKVDRALKDGGAISLGKGLDLRVIACPGHTPGSAAFYWEREGILFTGDSVTGIGSRMGGLPLLYYPADYERTLDKLERLDINTICLGHHYRSLTLARESVKHGRDGKKFVAESREVARIISGGMGEALALQPKASFLDASRRALAIIGERLPLDLNAETGLPNNGPTAALYANWLRYGER